MHNRTPRAAIKFETPYKKQYNTYYEFNDLHEFGQHVIIRKEHVDKLQNRGTPGQFVRYDHESKGYRVYWEQKVSVKRNVEFLNVDHPKLVKPDQPKVNHDDNPSDSQ